MAKTYFFSGSDRSIGTTLVTAGVVRALRNQSLNAGVFIPITTNARFDDPTNHRISRAVTTLVDISGCDDDFTKINPYSFELPNIPAISSKHASEEIQIEKIHDAFFDLSLKYDIICIDGGAGLLTPINDNETLSDILLHLNAELIIVTKPSDMFVSDVITTVCYSKQMGIPVAGFIVNGWFDEAASAFDYEQLEAIKEHVDVALLGKLPWFEDTDFTKPENHKLLIDEVTQRFSLELLGNSKNDWNDA